MKTRLQLRFLLFALFFGVNLNAQWQNGLWTEKQAYTWHFGVMTGLDFNTTPPTVITDTSIGPDLINPANGHPGPTFIEGTGCISDSDGNILFYTNGLTIWNANNDMMPNGGDIASTISSPQNGMIVPVPENPGHYYVFFVGGSPNSKVVYCEVDMSLDSGLGDVTAIKNVEIANVSDGKLSATYHADGEQIWVLIQTAATNQIKAFLVSSTGLNTTPVISTVGLASGGNSMMKVSPDGTKLATTRPVVGVNKNIQVFNFDNETGQVTDVVVSVVNADLPGELFGCYGVEFSPNSRFIYTTSITTGRVYQFDLAAGTAQDIKNSKTIIGQSTVDSQYAIQLGPDGKIYMAHGNFLGAPINPYIGTTSTLNVIQYPNNPGLASGYLQDAIDLGAGKNDTSIPCFIQSYFESGILYEGNQCPGSTVSFSTIRIPGITEIAWDFGDPGSGADNASAELEPSHIFSIAGTYIVTATITSNSAQQTATAQIIIQSQPTAAQPVAADLVQCAGTGGNAVFNLSSLNNQILDGQDPVLFTVTYYASDADVTADTPIADPASFTTAGQPVYAKVTNTGTGCSTVINFALQVNPLPVATTPPAQELCEEAGGAAAFDLTALSTIVLNGQDADDFTVAYFASQADMDSETAIANPEAFSSAGQTVYATVTNDATGCSTFVQFALVVNLLPGAAEPNDIVQCGNVFDLTAQTATILDGQDADDFTVTYYTSEANVESGIAIAAPGSFTSSGQDIYATVSNNDTDCVSAIVEFALVANIIPTAGVPSSQVLCEETGDTAAFDLTALNTTILDGQSDDDFTVTYFASQADMDSDTAIANPAAFTSAGQTVYATVTNDATGCSTFVQFALVVNLLPDAATPGDIVQCGDVFDLTAQEAVILDGQDTNGFTVAYYASEADLESGTPITNPESFTSAGQDVFVTVSNNDTGCMSAVVEFALVANSIPTAGVPAPQVLCEETGGAAAFDLTALNTTILDGQSANDFTVTYFASQADMNSDTAIANPAAFTSAGQTVYAAVTNDVTGCSTFVQFNLVVNLLPDAATPGDIVQCGDVFDLTAQEAVILDGQDPDVFTVAYYASEADVESGTPITNPESFTSAGQVVFATVSNNDTGCMSAAIEFALVANSVPTAGVPAPQVLCEETGGTAAFDLTALSTTVLDGQSANDFTITYFASQADMDSDTAIANPAAFTSAGQTVYVTVTNDATGCSTFVQFNLVVNLLPDAATPGDIVQCGDVFDLTALEGTILDGQDPDVFTVAYYASEADVESGTPITNPESFTSSGQDIYAVVTNNETGCTSGVISFIVEVSTILLPGDLLLQGCSPINLALVNEQLEGDLTLSFHETAEDADNGVNPIVDPQAFDPAETDLVIYIRGENAEGCTGTAEVHVISGDCDIQRGISPNGDTLNDFFDLTFLSVNKLGVFNRYGMEVYSKNNYANEWYGQGNNGDELPTGTYYYIIELNNGRNETGWIYINREE